VGHSSGNPVLRCWSTRAKHRFADLFEEDQVPEGAEPRGSRPAGARLAVIGFPTSRTPSVSRERSQTRDRLPSLTQARPTEHVQTE
jgi:hypothetical protein